MKIKYSLVIPPYITPYNGPNEYSLKKFLKNLIYELILIFLKINIFFFKPKIIYCNTYIYRNIQNYTDAKFYALDKDIIVKRERFISKKLRNDLNKFYFNSSNNKNFKDFYLIKFFEKKWFDDFYIHTYVFYKQLKKDNNTIIIFSDFAMEKYIKKKFINVRNSIFFNITKFLIFFYYRNRDTKKSIDLFYQLLKKNIYKKKKKIIKVQPIKTFKKIILVHIYLDRSLERLIEIVNFSRNKHFVILVDDSDKIRLKINNFDKLKYKNFTIIFLSSLICTDSRLSLKKKQIEKKINLVPDLLAKDDFLKFYKIIIFYKSIFENLIRELKPASLLSFHDWFLSSLSCHVANIANMKTIYFHINSPDARTSLYNTDYQTLFSPGKVINERMKVRFFKKKVKIVGDPIKLITGQKKRLKLDFKNKKIILFLTKNMSMPYTKSDMSDFLEVILENIDVNTRILIRKHPLTIDNSLDKIIEKNSKVFIKIDASDYTLSECVSMCDCVCSFTSSALWTAMLNKKPVISFLRQEIIKSYNCIGYDLDNSYVLNLYGNNNAKFLIKNILYEKKFRKKYIQNGFKLAKKHIKFTGIESLRLINSII